MNEKQMREKLAELAQRMQELAEKDRLTDEEQTEFDTISAERADVKARLDRAVAARQAIEDAANADASQPTGPQRQSLVPPETPTDDQRQSQPRIVHHRSKPLRGFATEEAAYRSGRWFMGVVLGDAESRQWCEEHGALAPEQRTLSTVANTLGGALVIPEFERAIVDLREQYGVFRQKARYTPMGSDTLTVPRRTGGLTAYFVDENAENTPSDKEWNQVKLTARKLACLTKYSTELAEDAIIDIAGDLAQEIAYAFSVKEDQCGFLGTGTSTYGGISGLITELTTATASTVTAATGNTAFSTLDLTDFEAMIGKLPAYPGINPEWYIHKSAWAASMMRLLDAAGGNTVMELQGRRTPQFLGYPVNFVQVMNSTLTAQTSTYGLCYFGDLSMAAAFGERRGIRIRTTDQRYFEYDQFGIQGTERIDINIHDVGDTSNAGPMVMLATPGS